MAPTQYISALNAARQTFEQDYCDGIDGHAANREFAAIEAERAEDFGKWLGLLLRSKYPRQADEYLVLFTESMDAIEGAWPGPVALASGRLAIARAAAATDRKAA